MPVLTCLSCGKANAVMLGTQCVDCNFRMMYAMGGVHLNHPVGQQAIAKPVCRDCKGTGRIEGLREVWACECVKDAN